MDPQKENDTEHQAASPQTGSPESSASAGGSQAHESSDVAPTDFGQHTQNYIEAYHATAEWIRFADAKAAVILTVGGAMGGLLIPTVQKIVTNSDETVHLFPYWQAVTVSLFILYILFLLVSGVYAFLCINPLRKKGKHPALEYCDHFHPAAISARYGNDEIQEFTQNCQKMGHDGLLDEVQAALLFDAHISTSKYDKVKNSLRTFAISVFFGFAYYLVLQL